MARTVNHEELAAKRKMISKTALALMAEKGYEEFSINQVISQCGISKGSFFHHFASKNELLEGIVEIIVTPIKESYDQMFSEISGSPRDFLREMFIATSNIKMSDDFPMEVYLQVLYSEDNVVFYNKVAEKVFEIFIPYYTEVITKGVATGDFNFQHPQGIAKHFIRMVQRTNEQIGKAMMDQTGSTEIWSALKEELEAFEFIARRLFGYGESSTLYSAEFYAFIDGKMAGKL